MAADGNFNAFKPKPAHLPFRPFFLAAVVDAFVGAAGWLPSAVGIQAFGATAISAGDWHRDLLLFGMVPAVLTGFLLTALPRWTGRQAVLPHTTYLLIALWVCSRLAFLLLLPSFGLACSAIWILALLLIAARVVIASRDRRNLKILLLLAVYCGSNVLVAVSYQVEFALRLALVSIIGLIIIIGGRVVPALTVAYVESAGGQVALRRSAATEYTAVLMTICALCSWVVAPEAQLTGLACALAGLSQAIRAAQWKGWRSLSSSTVLGLHIGYGWIVTGFAFLAIHIFAPAVLGQATAVHAWTIGAIGTMALAIMASMIRKHSRLAFVPSAPATGALAAMTACCLSRLLIEVLPAYSGPLASLSGTLWIVAFGLFLMAYRGTFRGNRGLASIRINKNGGLQCR
ncbi:NnrS family protein [Mesorhizobium sp. MSK_1335]|uniref:NnrS family protein n=1 Tax=Mesorhizobium montanum TaxID=3072323 RepID=A0ABU4ZSC2_9HYPH|nr:NnrS family protein [Mesorhizobium sp. MSK_1335]MDX8528302.1 NnrS family protein [Mesorhizobium sp. MSK_1335]